MNTGEELLYLQDRFWELLSDEYDEDGYIHQAQVMGSFYLLCRELRKERFGK